VILSTKLDSVYIHPTVVGPVVRKSHEEFNPCLLCCSDHFVEGCKVDLGIAVIPPLHDVWARTRTFAAVLWKATGYGSSIAVVEAPSAHDIESSFLCSSETLLDIGWELAAVSKSLSVVLKVEHR
jgi:hypothetical protein